MSKAENQPEEPVEQLADPPALPGRWTICAMLFVATSINYMDRQVLSILKPALSGSTLHLQPLLPGWPTLEASIHLTDVQYGNILAAFRLLMRLESSLPGDWSTGSAAARAIPL